ncbi:metallophosphoesterase, partial [Xinfangfangia pollutisoli]|uniref:metallophosphoesterase n=1 Tax=Xinfangfangia pollutisoli TaxID=2865960 RepID=UPI001CD7B589
AQGAAARPALALSGAGADPPPDEDRQGSARSPERPPGADALYRLRILATTDIHAQLLSYDYFTNRPLRGLGLARTASLIARARAEQPEAILLDNGDFLQGSALADLAATERNRHRPHPSILALNALGYDAVALGNHEFDYGLGLLRRALGAARFPALSANIALRLGPAPLQDELLTAPFALIRRVLTARNGQARPVTVGVLALTPPEVLDWDHTKLDGALAARPMVEAARAWLPELRRAGADLVVCLAHTGIRDLTCEDRSEGLAAEIAELPGVDAVISGHSHEVFPNTAAYADPRVDAPNGRLAGKPAVQPGHSGSHLGVLDFDLSPRPGPGGGWRIASARTGLLSAADLPQGRAAPALRQAAAPLRSALARDHRAALAWTRQPLGRSALPLTSYFALAADNQALRLIAAAKLTYARQALRDRPEAGLPILAATTPFRAGGRSGPLNYTDIPAGPLSVRHIFNLYPFPNTIVLSRITGAQLIARLEASAQVFAQIRPGQPDQPLLDPHTPYFVFEDFPGLSYRIDLSRPRGRPGRIRDLRLEGRVLGAQDPLVLVSSSFRLGTMPELTGEVLLSPGLPLTDVIARHIRDQGELRPITGPGWSFRPMPGTSVIFDSGSGAPAHLADVAHLRPQALGLTETGFHRFRLHL